MALQRAVLQPGGRELIVYGTINGAIGERWPLEAGWWWGRREDYRGTTHLNAWCHACCVTACPGLQFERQPPKPRVPSPQNPNPWLQNVQHRTAGVLYPFTSREDCDFFQHLEMHMRQEHPPLLGRDHLAYRCAPPVALPFVCCWVY